MVVHMLYGRTGLEVELEDSWDITVINKSKMPLLTNPEATLKESLNNPVCAPPLKELLRGKKTVCIVICDITRPVPNSRVLPVLVEEIEGAGISREDITVLIATGLHRPVSNEELEEIIGNKSLLNTLRVYNHYARRDEDHVFLGRIRGGIPVKIDRRFIQADLRIVIGLIEPHFMAGYSGGRKVITPGIAHEDTIRHIHAPAILEMPGVDNCNVEDNPLNEILVEIARLVGDCYGINTVIDDRRRISFINFGEIIESHKKAVEFARPYMEIEVNEKFPVVITSGGGYPLDRNYYQSTKGIVSTLKIIEPGGHIFAVSECSEGIGSEEFIESLKKLHQLGVDGFINSINKKRYADIDEWVTELLVKALKVSHVYLYTKGIDVKDRFLTSVKIIDDMNYELKKCLSALKNKKVAVIPEGPYVVPVLRK